MYMYISFFKVTFPRRCRLSYCEKRISMGRLVRCFMNIIFNALLYCVVKSGPFIIIGTEESTPVADQGGGSQNNPEFWGEEAPHVPYNPTPTSDENDDVAFGIKIHTASYFWHSWTEFMDFLGNSIW